MKRSYPILKLTHVEKPLDEVSLREKLNDAIRRFMSNDRHLLQVKASERAMCHKLAESLQLEFTEWQVDCEYNRNGNIPKRLFSLKFDEDRSVYPDIIVHHRGESENLLVIEAKRSGSSAESVRQDREKLHGYFHEHHYAYGALVTFNDDIHQSISFELISQQISNV